MLAIQTRALTRRFAGGHGVADLDLAVPQGVVYGFLGPNGAGKTTTIRLLLDLLRPDSGEIRLFDRPLHRGDRAALAQVGALVEMPSLYAHLDGRANLEISRRLLALPKARIDAVLERVGLAGVGRKKVAEYSLGMRQRLGIALALMAGPRLLVLDEPGNGLDPAGIQDLRRILRGLAGEEGITVFVSSHQLSEVELVATHAGVLDGGRLRFQGTLEEMRRRARPRLALRCDAPERATALLGEACESLALDTERTLHIVSHLPAAEINRRLVTQGVAVSHLALEPVTLESLFFELTGGSGKACAA